MCPNDGVSHVSQPSTIILDYVDDGLSHVLPCLNVELLHYADTHPGKSTRGDIIVELSTFFSTNQTEDYTLPTWCIHTEMYPVVEKNIPDFYILYDDLLRHC